MEEAAHWLAMRWARRRYFVEDGLIRPVQGSRLEAYDPFEHYGHDWHPRAGQSPLRELLELDIASTRDIEDWVGRYGLLGVFQENLLQARVRLDDGRGWTDSLTTGRSIDVGFREERTTVIIQGSRGMDVLPLADYYRLYLPGFDYDSPEGLLGLPALQSRELWDHLCEPVEAFRAAVGNLRRLSEWAAARPPLPMLAYELTRDLEGVHPTLHVGENGYSRGWRFRSLCGALLMMLREDAAGGRIVQCANDRCGKPFVAVRIDQRYCSRRCRNRVLMAQSRAAAREKP